MTAAGFDANDVSFVDQTDATRKTSIVISLSAETRINAIDGFTHYSIYQVDIRSIEYDNLDLIDTALQQQLQLRDAGRLRTITSGSDFVEDSTTDQQTFRRRRSFIID